MSVISLRMRQVVAYFAAGGALANIITAVYLFENFSAKGKIVGTVHIEPGINVLNNHGLFAIISRLQAVQLELVIRLAEVLLVSLVIILPKRFGKKQVRLPDFEPLDGAMAAFGAASMFALIYLLGTAVSSMAVRTNLLTGVGLRYH
jgi:hypothetical protein